MKSEKLMDCIGEIDDDIVLEADTHSIKGKTAGGHWIKWASVAAAACLIAAITFILNQKSPSDTSNLPKLIVNTEVGHFGFEGHFAYDVSELQNGNPWTENNNLKTMPVFINPDKFDSVGAPINGLSPEEMLNEAKKIANLLGLEITALYTEPTPEQIEQIKQKLEVSGASEEEIRENTSVLRATAECGDAKIEVQNDRRIHLTLTSETADLSSKIEKLKAYDRFTISINNSHETAGDTIQSGGLPLPSESFDNASNEHAPEITEHLFSEYGSLVGIASPGYDLFAEYAYNGVLLRSSTFVFENAGSLTERILNYHFNRLYFSANDLGGLSEISYNKTDLSQKIGDYPIITAKKARKLLLENHYITSVPEALPGEEYIAHVELIYRTEKLDTVFMPYYKFLVEMPSMEKENGLKTFGVFYVPAVQSDFLENLPLWAGSFN